MEPLLTQLVESIARVAPDTDLIQVRVAVASVLAAYDIKPAKFTAGHPDITEKVKLFLSAKKLEGLSPKTLYGYQIELRIFGKYIQKPIDKSTTNDIRNFLGQFPKLKLSSIARKLSVLKSFFGWLTDEEILARDPSRRIKLPKKEHRLPKALNIEELEMVKEACKTLRERALIEVMYSTGCRLSEVQQLTRQDIDWQNQSAKVFGKGSKEREVFFSVKAIYHLKKYLNARNDNNQALFVTERKPLRPMGTRAIQRAVKIIAQRSEIKKNIHPHIFRHTMATLTLNNGAKLEAVQSLLGHSNPSTTQVYAQLSDGRRREQHRRYLVQ